MSFRQKQANFFCFCDGAQRDGGFGQTLSTFIVLSKVNTIEQLQEIDTCQKQNEPIQSRFKLLLCTFTQLAIDYEMF